MSGRICNAALIFVAAATTACVRLENIQQTVPIRTAYFSGSPEEVAHCIHQRLGGKMQIDPPASGRYVLHDSVRGKGHPGLTHYAITIGRDTASHNVAELRIPPGRAGLTDAAVREYWTPVVECVERAKG